jgi:hypothetical protein
MNKIELYKPYLDLLDYAQEQHLTWVQFYEKKSELLARLDLMADDGIDAERNREMVRRLDAAKKFLEEQNIDYIEKSEKITFLQYKEDFLKLIGTSERTENENDESCKNDERLSYLNDINEKWNAYLNAVDIYKDKYGTEPDLSELDNEE